MGLYDAIDREACWAALLALLEAKLITEPVSPQLITLSRRHKMPPQLALEEQPALFVVQTRESRKPTPPGMPVQLTLHGFLILYAPMPAVMDEAAGQETALGATVMNDLLQAIDNALRPDGVDGKLTLGGLVTHCWLEGDVDMDTGITSQQGAAILPVAMLVP
jgi:hypothetical protein